MSSTVHTLTAATAQAAKDLDRLGLLTRVIGKILTEGYPVEILRPFLSMIRSDIDLVAAHPDTTLAVALRPPRTSRARQAHDTYRTAGSQHALPATWQPVPLRPTQPPTTVPTNRGLTPRRRRMLPVSTKPSPLVATQAAGLRSLGWTCDSCGRRTNPAGLCLTCS